MHGRVLRLLLAAPLLAAGLTAAGVSTGITAPALCSAATFAHHVSLVVEHGNARVLTACVGFDGDSISGKGILDASQIPYATAG